MYKVTPSLLNSWMYGTDCEAGEGAFERFLCDLAREEKIPSRAMEEGIRFENLVNEYVENDKEAPEPFTQIVQTLGKRLKGGQLQVRWEQEENIGGENVLLVGVADCVKAGIISDIKRVQSYEYGKYQHSAQHPMYMHLCEGAIRFDYLIFDGKHLYYETYRRGDYRPIEHTIREFYTYLQSTNLWEIYKNYWRV